MNIRGSSRTAVPNRKPSGICRKRSGFIPRSRVSYGISIPLRPDPEDLPAVEFTNLFRVDSPTHYRGFMSHVSTAEFTSYLAGRGKDVGGKKKIQKVQG